MNHDPADLNYRRTAGDDTDAVEQCRAFADRLYAQDPYYRAERAPFPSDAVLHMVTDGGQMVACCVTCRYAPGYDAWETAMIGWFDSVHDENAVAYMLEKVFAFLSEQGYAYVIGPMNGSTWYPYRLSEGNGHPFFLDVYHKPWYRATFLHAGFVPIATYMSGSVELSGEGGLAPLPDDIRIREFDPADADAELRRLYDLSILAFADNRFYTPISYEEFSALYAPMMSVVDPRFVLLCEDIAGLLVGYVLAVHNRNDGSNHSIVVKTTAVHPDRQGRGIWTSLAAQLERRAYDAGYRTAIYALYEESNHSGRVARRGRELERYHLYGREL